MDLVTRVKQTYELILENKSPSKINAKRDVIAEIAQAIQECVQFIAMYSETKTFCTFIPFVFAIGPHLDHRAPTRQECIF